MAHTLTLSFYCPHLAHAKSKIGLFSMGSVVYFDQQMGDLHAVYGLGLNLGLNVSMGVLDLPGHPH